jgi:hypothetical protein
MSRLLCWFKADGSNGSGGNNCVEVAWTDDGIKVRDSKDRFGPALTFSMSEWTTFVAGAKGGEFDRPPGT